MLIYMTFPNNDVQINLFYFHFVSLSYFPTHLILNSAEYTFWRVGYSGRDCDLSLDEDWNPQTEITEKKFYIKFYTPLQQTGLFLMTETEV